MSWTEIAVVSVTVLVGSTMQGSIGFGMGLLASPILMLVDPRFVPAPVLLATLFLTSLLVVRERRGIDFSGLGWAVAGRFIGTGLAVTVLVALPEDRMTLLFGGLVLLGVGLSLSGLRLTPIRRVLVGAGALSGVMGTVASIGGPPMALLYQDAHGARLRGTMSGFFWIGTTVSLAALWTIGRFGSEELRLTLILIPAVLLGFLCSGRTSRLVDRGYTRSAVLAVAALTGVLVIFKQIL